MNDPPVANDDSANTDEDNPVDIDVVGNDVDSDGVIDPTTVVILSLICPMVLQMWIQRRVW